MLGRTAPAGVEPGPGNGNDDGMAPPHGEALLPGGASTETVGAAGCDSQVSSRHRGDTRSCRTCAVGPRPAGADARSDAVRVSAVPL